ncbi:hypothetical protein [Streptomyces decoyicus]|uniref:hypothetical protein n=1 Tax=Streptomyces decoyicus TaxID=249567 RepID=UPI0037F6F5B1
MVTEQIKRHPDGERHPDDADVTRADSLAREIFAGVANKWALLIINVLDDRTLRFTELRTAVDGMCAWTRRYLDEIESARSRFDARGDGSGPPGGA